MHQTFVILLRVDPHNVCQA